jgi:hypothetical protein
MATNSRQKEEESLMRRKLSVVLLSVGLFFGAATPAFAHGGSVTPPGTETCRGLAINLNGNGSAEAAEDGLTRASISGVVKWAHC